MYKPMYKPSLVPQKLLRSLAEIWRLIIPVWSIAEASCVESFPAKPFPPNRLTRPNTNNLTTSLSPNAARHAARLSPLLKSIWPHIQRL